MEKLKTAQAFHKRKFDKGSLAVHANSYGHFETYCVAIQFPTLLFAALIQIVWRRVGDTILKWV